jgi:uncharacterized membrane protein YfcA
MGKEIIGSFIMASAGFLLMIAIEGKILEIIFRIVFLFLSLSTFYIGMRFYHKYMPKESLGSKDWLIILLSIITPFIVVTFLESLGILFGGIGILIWLIFAILVVLKTERIIDVLFPKLEKDNLNNDEALRRRLNPQVYSLRSRIKREEKEDK